MGDIVKTGDPNGPGLPAWRPFGATATVMRLGDNWSPIAVAIPARIGFWRRYDATQAAW